MSKKYKPLYEPRDELQEKSVSFLTTSYNHQLSLNLGTSFGKTFTTAYATNFLNEKTIIIVPNEGLKNQWIRTYHEMLNYDKNKLINIAGSNIINGLMDDSIEPADVYFVNHATLRNYMTSNSGYALHNFFKKIKVGIKVYDESHLDFGNILLIDFFTNTNKTWYLTATFSRSDKTEAACFERAFASVTNFGELESQEVAVKHVIYHVVNINSRATMKEKIKMNKFPGMSKASYGRYAFIYDQNQTAYNAIKIILEKIKDIEGKILIFVPLIEVIDDIVIKLEKEYPDKLIGAYHSNMNKKKKEEIKNTYDIIVSTIASLGTGADIKGLRCTISVEPYCSKIVAQQLIGRLRPLNDKDTYVFDIVDVGSVPAINYWHRARFKKIQTLVKGVVYLNLDK